MEIVKILLITVLPAVVLGCIAGVILGKRQVKKANHQLRSLLSFRERIAYSASVALGVTCVLLGIFIPTPAPKDTGMDDPGMMDGGDVMSFDDGMGKDSGSDLPEDKEEALDATFDAEVTDASDGEESVDGDILDGDIAETEPAASADGGAVVARPRNAPAAGGGVAIMR